MKRRFAVEEAITGANCWAATLPLFVAIITLAAASSGCSDGRKSTSLDRKTALALLKETPQIFKGKEEKRDINLREVIGPATAWDQKRGELTIAFLDVLDKVGVINQKKETPLEAGAGFPARSMFNYSMVPQENVESLEQAYGIGGDKNNPIVIVVVVARPAVKEVVGIRQEGGEALVDASVTMIPTTIYEKVLASGKDLFAQCATFPEPKPYFCVRWDLREQIAKPRTETFGLVRYDDGWRVEVRQ